MSTPVSYNGVTYFVPAFGDVGYAQGAGNLSSYLIALASGSLTTAGGTFTLTGDVNFGYTFGLIAKYFTSVSANPASTGTIRLAHTDTIDWRNFANTGDLALGVNASDQLTYQGVVINTGSGFVTSITGTAHEIIASSSTGAVTLSTPQPIDTTSSVTFGQITDSGLTPNTAVATNGSSQLISSSTTAAELAFVHGVTSSIQTQLNAAISNPLTSDLAAGGHKITGLANGTVATDAATFGQIYYGFQAPIQFTTNSAAATTSTSFVSTNLSTFITPTNTAHRVKITVSGGCLKNNAAGVASVITLFRNGIDLSGGAGFQQAASMSGEIDAPVGLVYIDSPSTTSSVTYSVEIKTSNASGTATFGNGLLQVMTLEEIV